MQDFRDNELWVREVNLVFDVNKSGLISLYRRYSDSKVNLMTLQDAINLIAKDIDIGISIKDV